MSRNYSSYSNSDSADWYAHDEGLLELQQERAQELASERTKDDVIELAEKGKVTLADDVMYDIHELLANAEPEFFELYILDNLEWYFDKKSGNAFMEDMMQKAAEKCKDLIFQINYEAL